MPKDLEAMMTSMLHDIQVRGQERELAAIADDPAAHKLTQMIAEGKYANYRWFRTANGRGQVVRFCWSVHRNAAGYFLGWRETILKRPRKDGVTGKRDQWAARKQRKAARALALRRRDRLAAKGGAS